MKSATQSMSPQEAAKAFYGLDDESFAKKLEQLTASDPRLAPIFLRTRQRFLAAQKRESDNTTA